MSSVGLLFHEALHGYGAFLNKNSTLSGSALVGAYSDHNLKTLFGITSAGSTGITDHINKYCGAYLDK